MPPLANQSYRLVNREKTSVAAATHLSSLLGVKQVHTCSEAVEDAGTDAGVPAARALWSKEQVVELKAVFSQELESKLYSLPSVKQKLKAVTNRKLSTFTCRQIYDKRWRCLFDLSKSHCEEELCDCLHLELICGYRYILSSTGLAGMMSAPFDLALENCTKRFVDDPDYEPNIFIIQMYDMIKTGKVEESYALQSIRSKIDDKISVDLAVFT